MLHPSEFYSGPYVEKMGLRKYTPRAITRRVRKQWQDLKEFLIDLVLFIIDGTKSFFYEATLPVTRRLFSRRPTPPVVGIKDVRCKRIRLDIKSSYASVFNVEEFEVEWARADSDDWTSVGKSDLRQRTVARLQQDTVYKFRVRAHNHKGCSGWSSEVSSRTKIEPKDGGGPGPGFVWAQTPTDVTITFELPPGTTKRDVRLDLRTDAITVKLAPQTADGEPKVLLDGPLYGKVKSFDNGSFWELVKEGKTLVLILTLEKSSKSLAPKFDYWRAIIPGQHEIDTHVITSEEAGTGLQMIQPGQMDADQMRALGIR